MPRIARLELDDQIGERVELLGAPLLRPAHSARTGAAEGRERGACGTAQPAQSVLVGC
jgi:hypothetical protein